MNAKIHESAIALFLIILAVAVLALFRIYEERTYE